MDWLPRSRAILAGGVVISGSLIAGTVATARSSEPGAAGPRAGLFGSVAEIIATLVEAVSPAGESAAAVLSPPSSTVFFAVAGAVVCVVATLSGPVCGWIGGRVATLVVTRWTATAS